jgi:four helix bundle protein
MSKRFEELDVRNMARWLNKKLGVIFYDKLFRNYSFQDQIMRACQSVSNNIAEWRERWSDKDFVRFLYYAKWSIGEVRNMLYSALDFWYITDNQFNEFYQECIWLSVKINNFIQVLK